MRLCFLEAILPLKDFPVFQRLCHCAGNLCHFIEKVLQYFH